MSIGALVAALMLIGAGAGMAVAEPGDESGGTTETPTGDDPGNVVEPETTPTATTVPRTLSGQLRDILRRPLSVFGNGRHPGQPPSTAPRTGGSSVEPTTRAKKKPAAPADEEPVESVPEVRAVEPAPPPPLTSTAEVRLPFVQPVSVPVLTFPGTGGARQWSVDLTSPAATYGSVEQTFATFNSLMVDAYAPYDPFPDPQPVPGPAFRITEEEPVVDAGGGDIPMSGPGDGGLPTIEAPLLVPRVAVPRVPEAVRGVAPAPGEVIAGGTAGVPTPGLRGSVAASGTAGERAAAASGSGSTPMSNPAMRQGYTQYLRTARLGDVAVVALPGLIGLLAITAGGGVIGYRQANSTRYLHDGAVRFLQ
jgi:hypothetical protein